jgi:transposase-like protein
MPASPATFYSLTEKYPDEASAEAYFVAKRWPKGVACPKCGTEDVLRGTQENRRRQLWYCHNEKCEYMFSVTSGTVMEDTKLPLRKWLLAFHMMGASKKGISALQLSRMLHTTYKTAWHLCHRIRATMTDDSQKFTGIVETDETYIGGRRKHVGHGYRKNKMAVQTIVKRGKNPKCRDDCGPGDRSQAQTIALGKSEVDGRTVGAKLRAHTDPERTVLMTDESSIYERVGQSFKDHHTVNHKREDYAHVASDGHLATTNTAEGLFANLKRQINGTHHHTSKRHLPKYLEEFDFKYNRRGASDVERTEAAIGNMEGKRLHLYKPANGRGESLFDRKVDEPRPDYVTPEGKPERRRDEPVSRKRRNIKRSATTGVS